VTRRLKTPSEQAFEAYIRERNLAAEYEPSIPGKSKRPDYRVMFDERPLYFEVKEFGWRGPLPRGGGAYDPTGPIRNKIDKARKKFKEFKEASCTLVLYNTGNPLIKIDDPRFVFAAMLGDFGFQFRVHPNRIPVLDAPTPAFLNGGKMIRPHWKKAENTRIGALITLDQYPVGWQRWRLEEARRERRSGRVLSLRESRRLRKRIGDLHVIRAVVHDNPFAKRPLPTTLFRGPYDERWTHHYGVLRRTYAGPDLEALEAALTEAGQRRR
jgi:hypothetical protein